MIWIFLYIFCVCSVEGLQLQFILQSCNNSKAEPLTVYCFYCFFIHWKYCKHWTIYSLNHTNLTIISQGLYNYCMLADMDALLVFAQVLLYTVLYYLCVRCKDTIIQVLTQVMLLNRPTSFNYITSHLSTPHMSCDANIHTELTLCKYPACNGEQH